VKTKSFKSILLSFFVNWHMAQKIGALTIAFLIIFSTFSWLPVKASEPIAKGERQSDDPEYSVSNEYLSLYVEYGWSDGIGTATLETSEGYDLLYTHRDHNAWSSYLTVQIDGMNYANSPYSPSLNDYVIQYPTVDDNAITTKWSIGSIQIEQTIELAGEAAKWIFTISNTGTSSRQVKVRYLFDYQVREQDGAPIYVPEVGLLKKETKFTGGEINFDYWFTRDYLDSTYTVQGRHTLSTRPYMVIFANWAWAVDYLFDYPEFDPNRAFYTPGEIYSPESDSSALIYWDLATINPGETKNIVTYYGTGKPAPPGIDGVKYALDEYEQNVIAEALDSFYYYAAGMAKGYKKWGERFKNNLISYLSNQTGEESFSRLANSTYGDYINKTMAKEDAEFLKNMFARVNSNMNEDEMRDEFYQYLVEKSNPLIEDFKQDFSIYRNWILDNLTAMQSELSTTEIETFARIIRSCEKGLPRASLMGEEFLDLMNRTIHEQPGPYFLGNVTFHASPGLIAVIVICAVVGFVSAWLLREAAEYSGAETCSIVSDSTAEECWQTGEQAASIASLGVNLITKPSQLAEIIAMIKAGFLVSPLGGIAFIAAGVLEGPAEEKIEELCTPCQRVTDFSEYIFNQIHVKLEVVSHTATDVTEPVDANEILGKGYGKIIFKNVGDMPVEPKVTREDIRIDGPTVKVRVVSAPERVAVGESGTIEYEYVVNLADVNQDACSNYLSTVTIHASHLKSYTTSSLFTVCNRGNPQESQAVDMVTASIIDEGRLYEGESLQLHYTTLDDTQRAVFSLTYVGSDLDLHLSDEYGNHVGVNYFTGEVENEIPGAWYSGPSTHPERIEISDEIGSRSYTVEVIAVSTDEMGADYVVVAREVPEIPAIMELYPKYLELRMKPSEHSSSIIYVRETGGILKLSNVLLEASDLISGEGRKISSSNIKFSDNNFDVDVGSSTFVIMNVSIPDNTFSGIYTGHIIATAENDITDISTVIVSILPPPLRVQTWITDSDFENIENFGIVFTPVKTDLYALTATNPGQFYYNILANNIGGSSTDVTITYAIDENFSLKDERPIHVYSDLARTIDITENCAFSDNTIIVEDVPPGAMVYATIHLDFALKKTIWPKSQAEAWYSEHTFQATANGIPSSVTIGARAFVPTRKVSIQTIPSYKSGKPCATLTYMLIVWNRGDVVENYALSVSDNAGWGPTLSSYLLENVKPGRVRVVTLSVRVPEGATYCTRDIITVVVSPQGDPCVGSIATCQAHVYFPIREVSIQIFPSYKSGSPCTTLTYTLMIMNKGNVVDNYSLSVRDNSGWGPTLSTYLLKDVRPCGFRFVTLSVHVPEGATYCTRDNITVVVSSQTDPSVSSSASCIAHVSRPV